MRILCRHGHFAFLPENAGDVSLFCQTFKINLVRVGSFYTFEALADLPDYSLATLPFGNIPAIKTYEGKPWEVMRENQFVFSLSLGRLVPLASIASRASLINEGNYYMLPNQFVLIQPGSFLSNGTRMVSYDAEWSNTYGQLRITEFDNE